jgi:hypothetical protein
MSKYTKGPWNISDHYSNYKLDGFIISDENYWGIAHLWASKFTTMEEYFNEIKELNANAKLIAAAPELIEALKDITDYVMNLPASVESLTVVRKALTAINKVEGN